MASVAILMGSRNDYEVMKPAEDALAQLGVESDVRVLSAHRNPEQLRRYVGEAGERGIAVFICGAGGAAHLAGAVAAHTALPVLGVPISSSPLLGFDALLATVQMPPGIPVATFGVGAWGAKNAGLFAAAILAGGDAELRARLAQYREQQSAAAAGRPG